MDALPALRREQRHDVVAGLDERDALADPLDHARALVPEHARGVPRRVGAGGRVEIRVADAAPDETNERLAGLRLGELDLLDGERLAEFLEHGGADTHRADPSARNGAEGPSREGERPAGPRSRKGAEAPAWRLSGRLGRPRPA